MINRRELLRRLGVGSAVLPFLGNLPSLAATAPTAAKKRLVVVFSPDGVVKKNFWPTEMGAFSTLPPVVQPVELPPILRPFEPLQDARERVGAVVPRQGDKGRGELRPRGDARGRGQFDQFFPGEGLPIASGFPPHQAAAFTRRPSEPSLQAYIATTIAHRHASTLGHMLRDTPCTPPRVSVKLPNRRMPSPAARLRKSEAVCACLDVTRGTSRVPQASMLALARWSPQAIRAAEGCS